MKKIINLFLFLGIYAGVIAQELDVTVTVSTPKIQTADPKVFENLEQSIQEFMNNQRWTEDYYEPYERIQCNIQLTITEERNATNFKADLGILATRPVFNSNYKTVLMTHLDKNVVINYSEFKPLQFTRNAFTDNLTSILSFYAYLILGLDNDSFAPFGGEVQFQEAQNIINTFPQSRSKQLPGWTSAESKRNRYYIMETLLSPRTRAYRQAFYDYHRKGMDIMHEDTDKGKVVLVEALEKIDKVNASYPNSMILQMFSNSKATELIEIFKQSTKEQKSKVIDIMTAIDAAGASKFRAIGI